MECGRKRARRSAPGGLGRSLPSAPGDNALQAMSSPAWAHIQALIESGGQIMIGSIAPIHGAAVAHDGTKTLAWISTARVEPNTARFAGRFLLPRKLSFCQSLC